jgi:hypothetical protein
LPPATNQKTATDKNKLTMPKRPNAIENLQFTVICLTIEPDTYRKVQSVCLSVDMIYREIGTKVSFLKKKKN